MRFTTELDTFCSMHIWRFKSHFRSNSTGSKKVIAKAKHVHPVNSIGIFLFTIFHRVEISPFRKGLERIAFFVLKSTLLYDIDTVRERTCIVLIELNPFWSRDREPWNRRRRSKSQSDFQLPKVDGKKRKFFETLKRFSYQSLIFHFFYLVMNGIRF